MTTHTQRLLSEGKRFKDFIHNMRAGLMSGFATNEHTNQGEEPSWQSSSASLRSPKAMHEQYFNQPLAAQTVALPSVVLRFNRCSVSFFSWLPRCQRRRSSILGCG